MPSVFNFLPFYQQMKSTHFSFCAPSFFLRRLQNSTETVSFLLFNQQSVFQKTDSLKKLSLLPK
jgi:hypothetical protein